MLDKFNTYYKDKDLFDTNDKILLTVSGGKDSIAMLHLFNSNNLMFGIAHCNFQLRGHESDKDEEFVLQLANKYHAPFHSINFNTKEHAIEKGISIQMAARELRYEWFEKIRKENNYKYIATAHHKNDVAETILINLTKGTGLSGLHGIKNKFKFIVRPMLCFDSMDIDAYIKKHNIIFREDYSNLDNKYTRNAIRHDVIPELEKINPSLIKTLNEEAKRFLDIEQILESKVKIEKEKCFIYRNDYITLKINTLLELNPLRTYLYYFLKEYGFKFSNIEDIINGLNNQSGKTFYSNSHYIVKDRDYLILKENEKLSTTSVIINSITDFPFNYLLVKPESDGISINPSNNFAYLDAGKISYPLILRPWENGDTFNPLGMKGNKKVSDYLIDNKISVIDKKRVKVLESDGMILWLVGHRIDDNFKVTSKTKAILRLSIND
jgi:tRNA(Ile)-lysidine synthase